MKSIKKWRAVFASLAAVAALAVAVAPAAQADPTPDQINYSAWYTANYICGHTHYLGCPNGYGGSLGYNNGFHDYVISAYYESPGWGVSYKYCALTSYWRGYFNVETTDYHNSTWGCP